MRLAIMQPYVFPYIGYFQLLAAADKFIFYDDVAFIKQGWINRNNVLVNGKPHLFSIPVSNISSFVTIRETAVSYRPDWTVKFLKMLEMSYRKSPYFSEVFERISALISERPSTIAELSKKSVELVASYLRIQTHIIDSSAIYGNEHQRAEERIIDICKKERAAEYINPIGGMKLYDPDYFLKVGLSLKFVRTLPIAYDQRSSTFHPNLS
ncbi:MAG TPA: WbqC family protein, partial [Bacteroidia bacterium]